MRDEAMDEVREKTTGKTTDETMEETTGETRGMAMEMSEGTGMDRTAAEDFVYRSYLRAQPYQDRDAKDAAKRRPDLTREVIRRRAGTPCTVITGSKGKGSVAAMISQILRTRLRVGLMTSPHIADFCERIRIDGEKISGDDLVFFMSEIRPEIEAIDRGLPEGVCISPMGIQTDLALAYFNDRGTEFNVLECGKGARFDDVNNTVHDYAVISSIFAEHTRELGDTVEDIAADKAHVITGEQKIVYVAKQRPEVMAVIRERAERFGTPLKVYGRDFAAENIRFTGKGMCFDITAGGICLRDVTIPLMGEHQARNCALALALSLDVLQGTGGVCEAAIRRNLSQINWPGRMEVLSSDPFIMLDACINPASCVNVKKVMDQLGIRGATVIIGIPDDKDYAGVAREMASAAGQIILTRSQNPHYVFTRRQCDTLWEEGIAATWTDSVTEAIDAAKRTDRPIIILGTTSVVSEVKNLFSV